MGICRAKTPQKKQGKPAVTTRGSFDGPKGPQQMVKLCLFFKMSDSIIISLDFLVDPRTGSHVALCNSLAALRAAAPQRDSTSAVGRPNLDPSLPSRTTQLGRPRPPGPSLCLIRLREKHQKNQINHQKTLLKPSGSLLGASGSFLETNSNTPGRQWAFSPSISNGLFLDFQRPCS